MPIPVSAQINSIQAVLPSLRTSRQVRSMEPLSLLYLMALLKMFISSRFRCSGLPMSVVCLTSVRSVIMMPRSAAARSIVWRMPSFSSITLNGQLSSTISPDSSLPMSSTSFTSSSSRVEASQILRRHSACLARSSL